MDATPFHERAPYGIVGQHAQTPHDAAPTCSVHDPTSTGPSSHSSGVHDVRDTSSILSARHSDENSGVYETIGVAFSHAGLQECAEESLDGSEPAIENVEDSQQVLHEQPGRLQIAEEGCSDETCDQCSLPLPFEDNANLRCCAPYCNSVVSPTPRFIYIQHKTKKNNIVSC